MTVTPKFHARHREFNTLDEAERHEKAAAAKEEFDRAEAALAHALAGTQRTADGALFDPRRSMFRPYYLVRFGWSGPPHIVEFDSLGWELELDRTQPEGTVQVRVRDRERGNTPRLACGHLDIKTVDISSLYSTKAAAEAALLPMVEEWLREETTKVETLRKRVQS